MEKKFTILKASSDMVDVVIDGFLAELFYLNCQINDSWKNDSTNLLAQLANAQWNEPNNDTIGKEKKNAIKHLTDFKATVSKGTALICCYASVDAGRSISSTIESDSHRKEINIDIADLDYQMTLKDYKEFLKSYSPIQGKGLVKEYPERILTVKKVENLPSCKHCHGTGKLTCSKCHGIGKGDCPDCKGLGMIYRSSKEYGEEIIFQSRFSDQYVRMENGDRCPTCQGAGSFNCKACNTTGYIDCFYCNGTGKKDGATNGQEIKRLKETYTLYVNGELFLPDEDTKSFDVMNIKETLCQITPIVFQKNPQYNDVNVKQSNEISDPRIRKIISDMMSEQLVGLSVVAYELPDVATVTFNYDDNEYRILVIKDYAFATDLPSISFMENLLGTYKKKIK